jgi:hypothetical protein
MIEEESPTAAGYNMRSDSMPSPRINPLFAGSCLILALLKLWLVRGDEIACLGSPFDDIWYMQAAKDWYWLRSYRALPFGTPPYVRLPAYPLYVALASLTGMPLRIVNELLFLLAAFVFIWVLIKAGQSQALGLLLYIAIIFHPGSFIVNNLAYTDTLYAPVLLLSLAGLILLWLKRDAPRRLWYVLAAGVALAVLWHIRQESIVIIAYLGCYALLWFLHGYRRAESRFNKLKQFGVVVVTPLIVIWGVSAIIKTINYKRFGVFAADAMFTPDFEAASKALLRLKPQVPIRFVPIPRETRQRAYAVSPAFRELESYFEGDPGRTWASFGKDVGVETQGEISAGHFWWGLNQATYYAGYNKSARQASQFYRRMAREINAACADGRLTCRFVISPLIDPDAHNYLPYLPHSLARITDLFTSVTAPPKPQDMANLPLDVRALFDSVAHRRAALRSVGAMRIQGWAFNLGDNLQTVTLRAPDGQVLALGQLSPRPDVSAHYQITNLMVPLNTGFDLEIPADAPKSLNADIVFTTRSGKEFSVHRPNQISGTVVGKTLVYNIDEDQVFTQKHEREAAMQGFIWAYHGRIVRLLTYAGLVALVLLLLRYRQVDLREPAFVIMALLASVIVIRVAVFTFIDASAYVANDLRYIFPVVYLYTCLLLMLISRALSLTVSSASFRWAWRRVDLRKLWKKTKDQTA